MKKQGRFICVDKRGGPRDVEVWVDTQTGVNYVYIREAFSGGLSPLLDANGKPIVSEEYIRKN